MQLRYCTGSRWLVVIQRQVIQRQDYRQELVANGGKHRMTWRRQLIDLAIFVAVGKPAVGKALLLGNSYNSRHATATYACGVRIAKQRKQKHCGSS